MTNDDQTPTGPPTLEAALTDDDELDGIAGGFDGPANGTPGPSVDWV